MLTIPTSKWARKERLDESELATQLKHMVFFDLKDFLIKKAKC